MAGAWGWYRAVIRVRAHVARRGTTRERLFAASDSTCLQQRVSLWAADPRTSVPELRRALDDVIACGPRPEWESSALEADYLLAMRELDRPDGPLGRGDDEDLAYRLGGEPLPPNLAQQLYGVRRFLIREPERSRRVVRLAFANWLAHVRDTNEAHRKPAVRASFRSENTTTSLYFYTVSSDAPAPARRLSPRALARWMVGSPDARRLLFQWPWPSIRLRERREHRALLILLAGELHRRERGRPPSSEEALVGTYLGSLPDDGAADLDDGTATIVEDPRISAPAPQPPDAR